MRIAETIDAFYGDAGAKDGVSRSYKQAVEDLDAETIKALDGPYRYAWQTTNYGGRLSNFLQDHSPWANIQVLCILPWHQWMYETCRLICAIELSADKELRY